MSLPASIAVTEPPDPQQDRPRERAGSADGFVMLDTEGTITYASPSYARIHGLALDDVVGKPWDTVMTAVYGENAARELWAQLHAVIRQRPEDSRTQQHVRLTRPDGADLWLQVSGVNLADSTGTITGRLYSVRIMTAHAELEPQARQADKLRALGQMASGVAHDLNQSLALVLGYGDLARQALRPPRRDVTAALEALDLATRAAADGAESVKRLLQFARSEPDSMAAVVDVSGLLQDVAQLTAPRWRDTAQAAGQRILVGVDAPNSLPVLGWPSSLREALTNLVFNAVDAMPEGGHLHLRAYQSGDAAVVEVADTGIGIPPSVQSRVFEPYFTTKGDHGTGLGLSMVDSIVHRHGGQVSLESAPGEGSTFRIMLPLAPASALVAQRVEADDQPPVVVTPRRVLVVDDEVALANLAAHLLEQAGHQAMSAVSGEEALLLVRLEGPFDVLLTDLGMGPGMNGWDLVAAVRKEWPQVRLILATGWGASIPPEEARQHGVHLVLSKPYRAAQLVQAVESVFATDDAER